MFGSLSLPSSATFATYSITYFLTPQVPLVTQNTSLLLTVAVLYTFNDLYLTNVMTITLCMARIMIRARVRDFSPLLGVVVCFLAASGALYAVASSLSSRLEHGYVFQSIECQIIC